MKKVIVIVGPTAIGKTAISINLAKHFGFEIISGDSVSVYKKLNIGSAKPSILEQEGVKHHLIDVIDPIEQFSVADFQSMARDIIANQKVGFVVGGTGLYINALLYDYTFDGPKLDSDIETKYANFTSEELYNYLKSLDSSIDEEKIHPNNRKRVLRALDYLITTNKSITTNANKKEKLYDEFIIYLNVHNRDILYQRINKRVDIMIENGLEKEVRELFNDNIFPNCIGYKEFVPYFNNQTTIDEVINNIKQNSRHLAKRQITWFKNQMKTNFYEVDLDNIDNTIKIIKENIIKFLGE